MPPVGLSVTERNYSTHDVELAPTVLLVEFEVILL